jgi:hypothetical protein
MATDNFDEVNRQREEIAATLKTATGPIVRQTLLREMSRLLLSGHLQTRPTVVRARPANGDSPRQSVFIVCRPVQASLICISLSLGFAKTKNKIFVFVAAMIAIAVPATSYAASAGRAQQAQAIDYMLDDALGKIAFYPAPGYRSYLPSKYMVPSLEELELRVGQLPPGTKVHWTPYK